MAWPASWAAMPRAAIDELSWTPWDSRRTCLARVVVVGQLARLFFDLDVAGPGGLEELVGGLGPGHPGRGEDLAVSLIGPLDLALGVKRQDQGRDDQEECPVDEKHMSVLLGTELYFTPIPEKMYNRRRPC